MDTENSTNLYLQVCQTFLTCNYDDPSSFEDLYKLLPWLRQSLTCCICSHVLTDPMASTQSQCQHFICQKCRGGKMILRPSCSWCKNQDAFEVNQQLVVLIGCFKKICELIYHSPILEHIQRYDERKIDTQKLKSIYPEKMENSVKKHKKGHKTHSKIEMSSYVLSISVGQVLEDGLNVKQYDAISA